MAWFSLRVREVPGSTPGQAQIVFFFGVLIKEITVINLAQGAYLIKGALHWRPAAVFTWVYSCCNNIYALYETRKTVFYWDIQTPRRELKMRPAAEYFWRNSIEVFGKPMKHCVECLIYLFNRNKKKRVNERVNSSKFMLIKTRQPNLLYACDFLCFDVIKH